MLKQFTPLMILKYIPGAGMGVAVNVLLTLQRGVISRP